MALTLVVFISFMEAVSGTWAALLLYLCVCVFFLAPFFYNRKLFLASMFRFATFSMIQAPSLILLRAYITHFCLSCSRFVNMIVIFVSLNDLIG